MQSRELEHAATDRVIVKSDDLVSLANEWRSQGLSIGFTCGAFDLLHAGHVDYLEKAKALCDRLVVAVNSDDSIRRYKSPHRPIISQAHRMSLVAALRCVDAVVLMDDTRPARLISILHPDLYIKGGDYGKGELKSAGLVESYGGRCEIIPVEHDISSSQIIKRIEELCVYAPPEQVLTSPGPVIFLDRDGTLIKDVPFFKDPACAELIDGVGEGLRLLQNRGFRLVLVTNQQGIGLGYFEYDEFVAINRAIFRQLAPYGVKISKVYYCPHSIADECECRKPGSRLIQRALAEFAVNPEDCFMIGDSESDIVAAEAAGCQGILVSNGKKARNPLTVASFLDAAELVLKMSQKQSSS